MNAAIGVDIGGTKISISLGSERGRILHQSLIPTQIGPKTKACIRELIAEIGAHLRLARSLKHKVAGIGVGAPGPVNSERGILPRSPHLTGWAGLELKALLQKKFKIPVYLANDANAAAVAESIFGAAAGIKNFIYLTVSTGLGGGIFIDGKLLEGASFTGGEVGHMVIVPSGDPCFCGHAGCLEAYASGSAMARYAKTQMEKGRKTSISRFAVKGASFGAKVLGKAYRKTRDPLALESYERGAFYLGVGLANLINVINPERVIFGGGVFKSAPDLFWKKMLAACKKNAWPEAFKAVTIMRSKILEHVGDLGALSLVFHHRKFEKNKATH